MDHGVAIAEGDQSLRDLEERTVFESAIVDGHRTFFMIKDRESRSQKNAENRLTAPADVQVLKQLPSGALFDLEIVVMEDGVE
jgi:hypothetical protein